MRFVIRDDLTCANFFNKFCQFVPCHIENLEANNSRSCSAPDTISYFKAGVYNATL